MVKFLKRAHETPMPSEGAKQIVDRKRCNIVCRFAPFTSGSVQYSKIRPFPKQDIPRMVISMNLG
jgi:hypothetical protein